MCDKQILIVENDIKTLQLLTDYLKKNGFKVSALNNGDTVISKVRHNPPDAMLLELMLPGKDGLTICKEIRSFSSVPILIISDEADEIDRVLLLELGADDFVSKPFSPREVVSRVKAILRRCYPEPSELQLRAGPITLDPDNHQATAGESDLYLTPNEFELLEALISQPGRVFTRSDLILKIKGYDFDGPNRTIDSHIKNLRAKINKILPENDIIQTVYGIGYSASVPHQRDNTVSGLVNRDGVSLLSFS